MSHRKVIKLLSFAITKIKFDYVSLITRKDVIFLPRKYLMYVVKMNFLQFYTE